MKLSVIVVSYNVKGYLSLCIASALKAMEPLGDGASELIVVDNASSDGSVDWVNLNHPSVQVIALQENVGFSAANNRGYAVSRGDWILLLNPDTIVAQDTFIKVFEHVSRHPEIGGLGVPMFDGSGRWLPESKRGIPTPWASFCRLSGLWRLAPRSPRMNGYYFGHVDAAETADVEVLSGAFMWMRRAALDQVGMLDEAFFMYGEDIDLSLRILQGGWVNRYFSEAPIVHFKGESTKKGSLSYVRVFHDAMRIFSEKHFAGGQAWAMRWMIRLGIRLRTVSAFLHGWVQRHITAVLDVALSAFVAWATLEVHGAYTGMQHPLMPKLTLTGVAAVSAWWTGRWFGSGDQPFQRLRSLVVGSVAGLSLVVVYSALPETLRVSRLSALFSGVLLTVVPYFVRGLMVWLKPQSYRWRTVRPKVGLLVPGSGMARIREWVEGSYGSSLDVRTLDADNREEVLEGMATCDMVLVGSEIGGKHCLSLLRQADGTGADVRIVPDRLLLALGGIRRDGAPTARLSWGADGLGRSDRMRVKRRLDIFWSLVTLFMGSGRGKHGQAFGRRSAWKVLTGKATWLGFHRGWEGDVRLPSMPEGILFVGSGDRASTPAEARRLDLRYASDFGWMRDLELLMNLRKD